MTGSPRTEFGVLPSGCPKCGGDEIRTIYHKQGCRDDDCSCATCAYGSNSKEHREHLHRVCQTCHFDWIEPTLETPLIVLGAA